MKCNTCDRDIINSVYIAHTNFELAKCMNCWENMVMGNMMESMRRLEE